MGILIGNETWSGSNTSQVYQATHDGAGNSLPYMSKSFISFTFGGKAIEDFGLIVVTDGDRLERNAYAEFSDVTTTYDVLNGQLYWGSNFSPNKLDLSLATDGITEQQIDDFKEWFSPGKERELILSEHPNRAIIARVASVPEFKFLPFEKKTAVIINGASYETSTTVYRGEIQLSFVMDEPHWYGKLSYMPLFIDKQTLESLNADDPNPNKIETIHDKDCLKVILEDGIPYQSNLSGQFFLGNNNLLITTETRVGEAIVQQSRLDNMIITGEGLDVGLSNKKYLFYSGTAPSYPTIKFTIYPSFDYHDEVVFNSNWCKRYVNTPKNSYVSQDYSYIKLKDTKTNTETYFYFTTPSLLTSLNKALYYFKRIPNNTPAAEVINDLTEQIPNYYARAWAIACVKSLGVDIIIREGNDRHLETMADNMMALITNNNFNLIPKKAINEHINSEGKSYLIGQIQDNFNSLTHANPITFTFNSKTGEAKMNTSVRVAINNNAENNEINIENNEIINIEENIGDMVCSNYLTIEGRNYLNEEGKITMNNCKEISSDLNLYNVLVFYQNMYL